MDALLVAYGTVTVVLFAGILLTLIVAALMPKEQRSKILHSVGQGFKGL